MGTAALPLVKRGGHPLRASGAGVAAAGSGSPNPQGEQVGQEQEHPQVGALAIDISGHTGQGIGQLLPGQARHHPGVGRRSRVHLRRGEIDGAAAGAIGELQQGPAVVDQLKAIPQAREGWGVPARDAQHKGGCGLLARRRKYWESSPSPETSMGHGPIHARSALFW